MFSESEISQFIRLFVVKFFNIGRFVNLTFPIKVAVRGALSSEIVQFDVAFVEFALLGLVNGGVYLHLQSFKIVLQFLHREGVRLQEGIQIINFLLQGADVR